MKKLLTLIAAITVLIACSKDDEDPNAEKNIRISANNIEGVWYPKQLIQNDGSLLAYQNKCATRRDSIHFNLNIDIYFGVNLNCGNHLVAVNCHDAYITDDEAINLCTDEFAGTITTLTNKTMVIDYGELRTFSYPEQNFSNCKGIVLSRD